MSSNTIMNINPHVQDWYAIYTKARFEKKMHASLIKAGISTFLPIVKEKRKWSDRIKTITVPLLPSYVFVQLGKKEFSKIYYQPGFVRFVSFEGQPCIIKDKDILLLKNIVQNGMPVCQDSNCKVGDQVRISKGPLKGWEGKVVYKKSKSYVIFGISGIGQSISVEVAIDSLEDITSVI